VRALAGVDSEKVAKCLLQSIEEDKIDKVAEGAARVLGGLKSDDAADVVCKAAKAPKGTPARQILLLETLGRIQNPKILPTLMTLLKNKDRRYQILGMEGLANLRAPEAEVITLLKEPALQDKDFGLQISAVAALAQTPHKDSIPILLELIKVPGRIQETAVRGLMLLTGQALGEDVGAWTAWWQKEGKGFALDLEAIKAKPWKDVRLEKAEGEYDFYGIKLRAKRVVFIIDKSGSMAQGDYPRRIDGVKAELTRLVQAIDQTVRFNIIFYSHEILHWKGYKLQAADEAAKKNAAGFIRIANPDGATHTDEVMERAFRTMVGPERVEAICLLTDGAPFRNNAFLDMAEVAAKIRALNRFEKVQIHTIGCFTGAAEAGKGDLGEPSRAELVAFLQRVAAENDGGFQEVKGEVKVN